MSCLFNNLKNYIFGSALALNLDPTFHVDFRKATNETEFTSLVHKAKENHGRGLDFIFPDSDTGVTQALFVGSIHGGLLGAPIRAI